jgi:glucokinase
MATARSRRDQAFLGIDIGGTKTAYLVATRRGRVLHERVIPTPRAREQPALDEILGVAHREASPFTLAGCGMSVPAVIEGGTVSWSPESFRVLAGTDLRARAEATLGVPTAVEYDGYAAALGERWRGRSRGFRDCVVVIVGTGIGGGFIHDGSLYRGVAGVAGAVGWLPSGQPESDDALLEDVASGTAILRRARRRQPAGARPYPDTPSVFLAAEAGDKGAKAAVDDAIAGLGAAVGTLISLLAPEIVVLGGGVGSRRDVVEGVCALAKRIAQPYAAANVVIEPSSLGGRSSLFGAAYLAVRAGRTD